MKKQDTTNTFNEGLIMDLNPLVTPNNVVTNCLNGTLITYNGNENVLQNDMGNGRVETAFLPEGYVPMGTAELGGIVYIVSYNPLINKCQIGSFPSPERNVTTDEVSDEIKVITNDNFQITDRDTKRRHISNNLVKLKLLPSNISVLNPGDKYTIYSTNIYNNMDCISDCKKDDPDIVDSTPRHVTIHVVSLSEDGKITYLDSSQKWIEKGDIRYYIKELNSLSKDNIQTDLDEYRSLVSSAYNIFNSKNSGELALLFEVKIPESFSATWDATITNEGDKKNAQVKFYVNQNEKINPKYLVLSKSKLTNVKSSVGEGYTSEEISFPSNLQDAEVEVGNFIYDPDKQDNPDKQDSIWEYTVLPAMIYGEIPFLAIDGKINFSNLGSGKLDVINWRYFIQSKDFYLNFGLELYPEINKSVSDVTLTFIPIESIWNDILTEDSTELEFEEYQQYPQYVISGRKSYSGYYNELINFGDYDKITHGGLKKDYLYLVDVGMRYGFQDNWVIKHNYRWLYTTGQWNENYITNTEDDFNNDLDLTNIIDIASNYDITKTIKLKETTTKFNVPEKSEDSIDSALGMKISTVNYDQSYFNTKDSNVTVKLSPDVSKYNNLFGLQMSGDAIIENTITNQKITTSNLEIDSDKITENSEIVLPKFNKTTLNSLSTTIRDIGTNSNNITPERNNAASDHFEAKIVTGEREKTIGINVSGAIFTRIGADLQWSSVSSAQTVRPFIVYKSDCVHYGIDPENFKPEFTFGYGQIHNDGSKTTGFIATKYNQSGQQQDRQEVRGNGDNDRKTYINYWEDNCYNKYLNPWMLASWCPFVIVQYSPMNNYRVIVPKRGNRNLARLYGIWVLTDEKHYVPLETAVSSISEARRLIMSFLTQVCAVFEESSTVEKYIVTNIDKLKPYKETWEFDVNSTLTLPGIYNFIYLKTDNGAINLQKIINRCIKLNRDAKLDIISFKNLQIENRPFQLKTHVSHIFKLDYSNLEEQYEAEKATSVSTIWDLPYNNAPVVGTPVTSGYFYVYNKEHNKMENLNDSANQSYLFWNVDVSSDNTGRILINSDTSESATNIDLFKYLKLDSSNKVVAIESTIFGNSLEYHYYPDDNEYTSIQNNPSVKFLK